MNGKEIVNLQKAITCRTVTGHYRPLSGQNVDPLYEYDSCLTL